LAFISFLFPYIIRWWWCMQGESKTSRSRPCRRGWSGSLRSRKPVRLFMTQSLKLEW